MNLQYFQHEILWHHPYHQPKTIQVDRPVGYLKNHHIQLFLVLHLDMQATYHLW